MLAEIAQHPQNVGIVECVAAAPLQALQFEGLAPARFGDLEFAVDLGVDNRWRQLQTFLEERGVTRS